MGCLKLTYSQEKTTPCLGVWKKSEERFSDVSWYDYGFRFYDPALARFTTIDPIAEEPHNISLTPYHYTNNNPILYIDVNGEDWYVNQKSGNLHWYNGQYKDDNMPEGYTHLGGDDYFGEESIANLQEAQGMYEENTGETLNSLDFNSEESNALAENYGFEKGERFKWKRPILKLLFMMMELWEDEL
jgi:RHS repeat-associated protein